MRRLSIRRWWGRSIGQRARCWRHTGAWALWATTLSAPVAAQVDAPARDPLSGLVAGLLAFTHWPDRAEPVRLCAWGDRRSLEGLNAAALSSARRTVAMRRDLDVALAAQRCDALYLAASAPPAAHDLIRRMIGRPVLVIGEGLPLCAEGAMFCIDTSERPLRFQANLDAIARSGLRVDPQALRIGRSAGGAP